MTDAALPSAAPKRAIPVRAMGFPFAQAEIPSWWFFANPYPTHISNALNLLFPDGERFFIRSVKHYVDRIGDDPELLARVRGFFGQEGRHGHEHERYNKLLETQGYDVEPFLAWYRHWAFAVLEKSVPPVLRLSATAALEHYTATLAENALRGDFLDGAHPLMRDLLQWHAAEEIEHKSVAFDVLQKIDPRWSVRASGLLLASAGLLGFWAIAARELLAQERAKGTDMESKRRSAARNPQLRYESRRRNQMFREAIRDYLRPDFHPDQNDNYALARGYLASIGRLDG
ncbi:MAG: metal-dependent hydrolase [Myxococcota bacterium]|nr:metal-dependent hydrolase [Myxococcota bacterium]